MSRRIRRRKLHPIQTLAKGWSRCQLRGFCCVHLSRLKGAISPEQCALTRLHWCVFPPLRLRQVLLDPLKIRPLLPLRFGEEAQRAANEKVQALLLSLADPAGAVLDLRKDLVCRLVPNRMAFWNAFLHAETAPSGGYFSPILSNQAIPSESEYCLSSLGEGRGGRLSGQWSHTWPRHVLRCHPAGYGQMMAPP